MLGSIEDRFGNRLMLTRGGLEANFAVMRVADSSASRSLVLECDQATADDVYACGSLEALALSVTTSSEDIVTSFGYCGLNAPCGTGARTGDLSYTTGGRGNTTRFTEYDAYGNVLSTVLPKVGLASTTVAVFSTFDARSRLTSREESQVNFTDAFVRPLKPSGTTPIHLSMRKYDGLDHVVEQRELDSDGHAPELVKQLTYYPGGQVRTETNGLGLLRVTTLDALNRPETVTESGGGLSGTLTTTLVYDLAGNLVETTDRRGVKTTTTYDYLNRPVQVSVDDTPGYTGHAAPVGLDGVVSTVAYDKAGNKISETDLHGFETKYGYDSLYRLAKRISPTVPGVDGNPAQYMVKAFYDRTGNKTAEIDGNGQTTKWKYDFASRVTETRDAAKRVTRKEYDKNSNVTVEKTGQLHGSGSEPTFAVHSSRQATYDERNRPSQMVEVVQGVTAATYTTTSSYNDAAHTVSVTNPNGVTTLTKLDGLDRVHEQVVDTAGLGLATQYRYDANGNRAQTIDALGRESVDTYDGLNRLKKREVQPADVEETFTYDGEGRELTRTDRRGVVRKTKYDLLGRLYQKLLVESISNSGAELVQATTTYADAPNSSTHLVRTTMKDARNNETIVSTDALGRQVEVKDANNAVAKSYYDAMNLRATVDRRRYRTETDYDAVNRPVAQRDYEGVSVKYATSTRYDDVNRKVTQKDRNNVDTVATSDGRGRVVQTTRFGVTNRTTYDGLDQVVTQTDANGHVTKMEYDGASRVTQKTLGFGTSDAAATAFTYDAVGNLLTAKSARSTGVAYDVRETYDALNRSVRTEDANGNVTTRAFDAAGNKVCEKRPKGGSSISYGGAGTQTIAELMTTVCTGDSLTQYQYDEESRLIQSTDADGFIYRFRYDAMRNLQAKQDALARVTLYVYDGLNRRTGERQLLSTQAALAINIRTLPTGLATAPRRTWETTYDANGNVYKFKDPNGNESTNTYGALNRLTAQAFAAGPEQSAPEIPSIDAEYDGNGNVTKSVEHRAAATVTTTRTYDYQSRLLTEARGAGRTVTYEYDAKGNRTKVSGPGGDTTYTYDALDRIKTAKVSGGTATYSYYADGTLHHTRRRRHQREHGHTTRPDSSRRLRTTRVSSSTRLTGTGTGDQIERRTDRAERIRCWGRRRRRLTRTTGSTG